MGAITRGERSDLFPFHNRRRFVEHDPEQVMSRLFRQSNIRTDLWRCQSFILDEPVAVAALFRSSIAHTAYMDGDTGTDISKNLIGPWPQSYFLLDEPILHS